MPHFHNTKFQYTHKRVIKKIGNRFNQQFTNAESDYILHQIEDRETLVRTIIQLSIKNVINNSNITLGLFHEPRGITVQNVSETHELDQVLNKVELWMYRGGQRQSNEVVEVFVDLKSMRKCETGDQITLRGIASTANSIDIIGSITLFFKET